MLREYFPSLLAVATLATAAATGYYFIKALACLTTGYAMTP
ncbi:MAG: hypothetical protein ACUVTZ_06160 [Armatimonadota bacterium]